MPKGFGAASAVSGARRVGAAGLAGVRFVDDSRDECGAAPGDDCGAAGAGFGSSAHGSRMVAEGRADVPAREDVGRGDGSPGAREASGFRAGTGVGSAQGSSAVPEGRACRAVG